MTTPTIRLVVYLLFCAIAARSQTATGSIVGTVTDSSGAAVASAKVVVTNASTNAKIAVISNAEGDFTSSAGTKRLRIRTRGKDGKKSASKTLGNRLHPR